MEPQTPLEDLLWKLRNPPTMSMFLNQSDLYKEMVKRMTDAADYIEEHPSITISKGLQDG